MALRLTGDKAFLCKVRIMSTQDTLLDEAGTHYFYRCEIQGTVDFICGNAKSLFRVNTIRFFVMFFNNNKTIFLFAIVD